MIVYMDLIFLVNFLLDGAILVGTARTRKLPVVWWRLLFSARDWRMLCFAAVRTGIIVFVYLFNEGRNFTFDVMDRIWFYFS
ncbi:sigma-E processing peptidase SpoIIGA [Paenibacillus larvae]|uniref:sigma-E processing peptidase SpoIIGA n=1 Tax=Paenibacillus larvae TaxID=1464 RepID=UPI0028937329|nr:sigma-E processing peptidase SpoIIGA [Paenibacillus larvae]